MARSQSSRFCVFCIRCESSIITTEDNLKVDEQSTTKKDNINVNGGQTISKFVKLMKRFVGCGRLGSLSTNKTMDSLLNSDLLKYLECCTVCSISINLFCDMYHQFKCLELQLDCALDKLVMTMGIASRVPSRTAKMNKFLADNFKNSSGLKDTSPENQRKIILNFRHNVIKLCHRRITKSTPRVLVERNGYLPSSTTPAYDDLEPDHKSVPIIMKTISLEMASSVSSLSVPVPLQSPPETGADCDSLSDHDHHDDELHSVVDEENDKNLPEPKIETTKLETPSSTFDNNTVHETAGTSKDNKNVKTEALISTTSKPQTFVCTICRKHFKNVASLKTHTKKVHSVAIPQNEVVSIANTLVSSRQALAQEIGETTSTPAPQRCSFREKRKQTFSNLAEKDDVEGDDSDKEFSPDNEPLSSSDLDENESGDDEKIVSMEMDAKRGRPRKKGVPPKKINYSDLSGVEGGFKCDFCPVVKDNAPDLAIHEAEHAPDCDDTSKKKFCCPRCTYTYNQTSSYVKHHLKTHLSLLNADCSTACTMCSGGHVYVKNSRDHYNNNHKIDGLDPLTISRCDECPAYFVKALQLQHHIHQIHRPDHKCLQCGKAFTKRKVMYIHMRNVHKFDDEDPKLPCPCDIPDCKKRFMSQGELEHHKVWVHRKGSENKKSKYESNTCKQCDKEFSNKVSLYAHVNKVHADRSLVCSECGKSFKTRPVLETHMEYHKGPDAWKFECTTCGKKCFDKYKLEQHMRTHTKEKAWICQFCGVSYAHRHNWKAHLLSKHGSEDDVEGLAIAKKGSVDRQFLPRKGYKKGENVLSSTA